jgi:hypothetical protein
MIAARGTRSASCQIVTIYLLIIGLLVLIPLVIGISYVIKNASEKRQRQLHGGREPKNYEPVTLDRSPEMPHRTDATS